MVVCYYEGLLAKRPTSFGGPFVWALRDFQFYVLSTVQETIPVMNSTDANAQDSVIK
jgi:hypothetical protein